MNQWLKLRLGITMVLAVVSLLVGCGELPLGTERQLVSSSLPVHLLWQAEVKARIVEPPLLTDDKAVFVVPNFLIALDLTSGKELWQQPTAPYGYSFPLSAYQNKIILLGDSAGEVTAFRADYGETIWKHRIGDYNGGFIADLLVTDPVAFVVAQPTYVEALDVETGHVKWQIRGVNRNIETRGPRLSLIDNSLYLQAGQEWLQLNKDTGEILQRTMVTFAGGQGIENRLYTATAVYDLKTFQLQYAVTPPTAELLGGNCKQFNLPYAVKDYVYGAGACGGVFAIDETGKIIWEYPTEFNVVPPMAVVGQNLFALDRSGAIHAIDAYSGKATGILKSNYRIAGVIYGNPNSLGISSNGSVLVVTFNDTNIWAMSKK